MVHVVSKQLTASINALLAGLRLESGGLTPSPEPLDPLALVRERLDWFGPLYEYVGRDVELTVEDPPSELRYDRQFFRLVLDSMLVLGSEEPEGETEIAITGTTESGRVKCFFTLLNSNPPWQSNRTAELETTLRHGTLEELLSTFSSRMGLFLYSAKVLLESQGGNLDMSSDTSDGVELEAVFRHRKLGPE